METEPTLTSEELKARLKGTPISDELKKAEVTPGVTTTPISLRGLHRLVARHQLKDRIKFLENIIKNHAPLVQAMQVTQKAYQEGIREGIRQVAVAEQERLQKEKESQPVVSPEQSIPETTESGSVPHLPLGGSNEISIDAVPVDSVCPTSVR
jgi:hypothetical protein